MSHKSLSHFYWCLIWFTLLHSETKASLSKASSRPETEPDASKVPCGGIAHHAWTLPLENPESNLDVSSLTSAMQPLPTTHAVGDATADQNCCAEGARGCKLPEVSSTLSGNGMENQAGGDLETVPLKSSKQPDSGKPSYSHNSNPQTQNKLKATVQQDCGRLPLQDAMEDSLCSDPSLLLPTETVHSDHQSMQVHQTPSIPIGHDAFEAELGKGSKPPGTGQPSPIHNSIPDSEISQVGVSLKSEALGLMFEELASGEIQAPPGSGSGGHVQGLAARNGHGGGAFVKVGDSSDLQNILARNSVRPGTGGPSKGHNSVTDGVAPE